MRSGFFRPFSRTPFDTRRSFKILFTRKARSRVCIVGFLLVIGGCAVLPGSSWRPGWNEEWKSKDAPPETAASWKLTELETKDNRFLGLAIEHKLPSAYVEWLRTFPSQPDPDSNRRAENEAIVFDEDR